MLGCRALLGQALPHHRHRHRLVAVGQAESPALLALALGIGSSLYRGLASLGSLFGGMAGKGSGLGGEASPRGVRAKGRRPARSGSSSAAAAAAAAASAALPEEAVPAAVPPQLEDAGAAAPSPAAKRPRKATAPSLFVSTNLRSLQPKARRIGEQLTALYPDPPIPLDHASGFQLLCAVVLSAQSTDKKVNEVTPQLFGLAPDAAAMAALDAAAIEACIRQLGLAPTKAKNLQGLSQLLVERHGGEVPRSFEELEALPGVGHKTASVVMAQVFGQSAFPVDTHIHRLAQRWGLTSGKSVEQTESDLKLLFPEAAWRDLHLQMIFFGREKCPARSHDPGMCPVCCWAAVAPYNRPGNSPGKPGAARSPAVKRTGLGSEGGKRKKSAAAARPAAAAKKKKEEGEEAS